MNYSKKFLGIKTSEYLVAIGFYLFFVLLYSFTLWYVGYADEFDYKRIKGIISRVLLDYLIKLLLSLPVWWIVFRKLRNYPLYKRLLVHLLTFPLFVWLWQALFYKTMDLVGMFHLTGPAQIWDIYIPALYYILQFSILHAYSHFREIQEKQKVEAQLREAALKSELSALKAQLNPHFLYNVFNTINASIPADLENTRHMIAELSDLFRYQLQASKSELVSLRSELDFTRKYLDLEKARYGERLQVIIHADEDILDHMVPPMIIQPLVENSLKHGIASQIKGGSVSVSVKRSGNLLKFIIKDTGKGVKDTTKLMGVGVGLTNTELRLNKMYGSSLRFSNNMPAGLQVEFEIA